MNNIHLSIFNHFQEPTPKSFWSFKSLSYLMTNIFTGGIVDTVDAVLNLSRIKHIKLKQLDLLKQATDLTQTCGTLETRLSDLLTDFKTLDSSATAWQKSRFRQKLNDLDDDQKKLFGKSVKKANVQDDFGFEDVIYAIITCVGHLIANVLTIGLYGAYQHCALNNRVTKLKAENKHIRNKVKDWQDSKSKIFKAQIDLLQNPSTQQAAAKPSTVDPIDQARLKQIIALKQEIDKLQAQQKEVENNYKALKATNAALRTQHADELKQQAARFNGGYSNTSWYSDNVQKLQKQSEQDKKELKTKYKGRLNQQKTQLDQLQAKYDKLAANGGQGGNSEDLQGLIGALSVENENLQEELTKAKNTAKKELTAAKNAKDVELLQARTQLLNANQRLTTLQTNVTTLQTNATALQADVQRLKPAEEYLPFKDRVGPIAPKYVIGKNARGTGSELEDIKGTAGIVEKDGEEEWNDYAKRYNNAKTATELFQVGFQQALKELYAMAKGDQAKIKLNDNVGTPTTPGAGAVYRYVALEFIKNGYPYRENPCHEFFFKLNKNGVGMESSTPENVIECTTHNGNRQLKLVTHYQRRDDFTPSEEIMSRTAAGGIDPLSANCAWRKLTEEEQGHVFHLLMEPAMEDTHPDYQKALAYLRRAPKARTDLMKACYELIRDMGEALQVKFDSNTNTTKEWEKYLDVDDTEFLTQPFTKTSHEAFDIKEKSTVEWNLDKDILDVKFKVKDSNWPYKDINVSFFDFINASKTKYQVYFKHLKPTLFQHQYKSSLEIPQVTWVNLNPQYYASHQFVIGSECLFSNLLATIANDNSQLTSGHIKALRKSMSTYLMQLETKKNEWNRVKNQVPLPAGAVQLEQAAKLFDKFQKDIKAYYGISMTEYKNWLEYRNNRIDEEHLTSLEIEIAAHTLGIRIGVFELLYRGQGLATQGKIDEQGRLIPVETVESQNLRYFGPNTEEVFLMTFNSGYSYYGLYPKLNLSDDVKAKIGDADFETLKQLDKYWSSIKMQ